MGLIRSINWTYTEAPVRLDVMDRDNRSQDPDREPSTPECECPDPCNCDHDNE